MDTNLIISPITGAVIGAFANWLAIQMLFFPLNQKKIFGMPIPFTPGLIPKERKRMAKSVASTVSSYFLNEGEIVNAIISPEAVEQFRLYIRNYINSNKNKNTTIEEIIMQFTGNTTVDILEKNRDRIIRYISEYLTSDNAHKSLCKALDYFLNNLLNKKISEIFPLKDLDKGYAEQVMFDIIRSESFESIAEKMISGTIDFLKVSEKPLSEVIPKNVFDFFKVQAIVNSNKISGVIKNYLMESSVQFKLRKLLKNNLDGSFKMRMISKLVDFDKIFDDMYIGLTSFLDQSESHKEISNFLISGIDKISIMQFGEVLSNVEYTHENLKQVVKDLLNNNLTKESIENIIKNLDLSEYEELSILDILNKFGMKSEGNISNEYVSKLSIYILNNIEAESIYEFIKSIVNNFVNMNISTIFSSLNEKDLRVIESVIIDNFKKLVKGESERIIKVIDVAKIVEQKINDFDIKEMVDIMWNVIKKDIITMRIFEAGIGFLIGLMAATYPYIYNFISNLIFK